MRRSRFTERERELWTAHVEGRQPKKESKYKNKRTRGFASQHEADWATNFAVLARQKKIFNLRFQVPVKLIPRAKVRGEWVSGVTWVADFVYDDEDGETHYVDAKGFKTKEYDLKKRIAALLLNIVIEEV